MTSIGPYLGKPINNLTQYHDRTVQDWHRTHFPHDHSAIDLDLAGACRLCYDPLYLIESTSDPNKHTGFLRALARKADTPALLIEHHDNKITRGVELYPAPDIIGGQFELERYLFGLRDKHALVCAKTPLF